MKQTVLITSILALALAFALAGCASSTASSSSASSSDAAMSASEPSVTASEASEEASGAPSESPSTSSVSSSAKWTEAKDAKAAAIGAGLGSFAVPENDVNLSIGAAKSKDWSFRFTDGIAEADGYAAAAVVVVREGAKAGDCTTPLSDYIANEWPALEGADYDQAWTQSVNDIEVTCFGNTKGVASKMTWNEDQHGFSVQVLGQGDNWSNFGIEEDDIEALVGAVIAANSDSDKKAASKADDDKTDTQKDDDSLNAEDYVESLVWQYGLGELVSYNNFQDDEGNWLLEVITRDADGNEHRSVIGADGSILESDFAQPAQPAQADSNDENAAADGVNNSDTDPNKPAPYSNTQAKQAVQDNNLGEYVYSQEVQGSDGNIYQEITTRDENGNNSYSYLDSNGDVVYDVDVELRYNNDGTADPAKKN